jgi:type III pantothenate kinase
MLLAVDVGNTNIVFALFQGRAIKSRWRVATDPRRTADEYAVWLLQLMQLQGFDPKSVKQILISTVVPRALHNIRARSALIARSMRLPPMPYSGDLIVIDFGTATTST